MSQTEFLAYKDLKTKVNNDLDQLYSSDPTVGSLKDVDRIFHFIKEIEIKIKKQTFTNQYKEAWFNFQTAWKEFSDECGGPSAPGKFWT